MCSLERAYPCHPRQIVKELAGKRDDGTVAHNCHGGHDRQYCVPGADVFRTSGLRSSRHLQCEMYVPFAHVVRLSNYPVYTHDK